MADVNNPKKGDIFYYLGRTRCRVIGETLNPGDGNKAEAVVQIETVSGTPVTFLYTAAGRYLSATQIPFYKKWPLTPDSGR